MFERSKVRDAMSGLIGCGQTYMDAPGLPSFQLT